MSIPWGTRIGPYEILSLLGAGGMGEVFRARDTRLNRDVALKTLPGVFGCDAPRRARFAQEARAAGSLNHSGIVAVYDIGTEANYTYIVTELVEGSTLRAVLTGARLPQRKAIDLAAQVADALAAAHAAGITHRDLKPENIMVTRDGRAKILDFGLAKQNAAAPAAASPDAATETALTEDGTAMGTIGYMAPEQIRARPADPRSDIFSLGAVLYEMLSGARAFKRQTSADTLSATLHDDPSALPASIPPGLAQIVQRCLEKEPAQRFQSAADLAFAMRNLSGSAAVVPAQPRSPRLGWFISVVAFVALIAAASGWLHQRPAPPVYDVFPGTFSRGNPIFPALSPDGKQLAFVWEGQPPGVRGIYVKLLSAGSQPLRVSKAGEVATSPTWSPDGSRIAFIRPSSNGTEILSVPAIGGAERRLIRYRAGAPVSSASPAIAWSPDGKWIAAGVPQNGPSGIVLFSVETGEGHPVTQPLTGVIDANPKFSPDGKWLAFARASNAFSSFFFRIRLNPDGSAGAPQEFGSAAWNTPCFDWFADGEAIVVPSVFGATCQYWKLGLNGRAARLPLQLDRETTIIMGLVSVRGNRMASIADRSQWDIGRLTWNSQAHRWESAVFYGSSRSDFEPQVSPDNRWVAFRSSRSGNWEAWRARLDGSEALQLTNTQGGRLGDPRWSPDGQSIVYEMPEEGFSHLFIVGAEGGKPRRLFGGPISGSRSSFSADGKWVFFRSEKSGRHEVWKVPFSGGEPQQVTHTGGHESFASPDGRWLYFIKFAIGDGVFRIPTTGGPEELVIREPNMAAWAIAGSHVYLGISRTANVPARIIRFDPATGRKEEIYRFAPGISRFGFTASLAVSPDETTIFHSGPYREGSDILIVDNFR